MTENDVIIAVIAAEFILRLAQIVKADRQAARTAAARRTA